MKKFQILIASVIMLMAGTEGASAQGWLKRVGEAVKKTAENVVESKAVQKTSEVIEGAIDGAKNAAILAAKILAVADDELDAKLVAYQASLKEQVKAKDAKLQEVGYKNY